MRWLVVSLLVCACTPQLAPPPWRKPPPPEEPEQVGGTVFTPTAPPAARYNDPAPQRQPSPVADAVAVAVSAAAFELKLPQPERDGRLDAAAAELAAFLPKDVTPPQDLTAFTLAHFGIIEPFAYVVVATRGQRDAMALADDLRQTMTQVLPAGNYRRLGVGAAQNGEVVRVVLALQESNVWTEPIPCELPTGGTAIVRGRVKPPFRDPRVYVGRADGSVDKPAVSSNASLGFGAEVKCGPDVGMLKIEIAADDPARGPTVLANFPVWCGVAPPKSHRVAVGGAVGGDASQVERDIFELVNRDRAAAGLAPLVWDDAAARAARLHSEEMRDSGYVGHLSPVTGNADTRASRQGVHSPLIAENVARDYSASEAQANLMASPGHRANILGGQVTHLGVGVAIGQTTLAGRTEVYVTQLFFQKLRPVNFSQARAGFARLASEMRAAQKLPPLTEDWQLRSIAEEFAETLAKQGEGARQAAVAAAGRKVDSMGERYRSVNTLVQVGTNIGDFKNEEALLDPGAGAYGLGVAQGNDPHIGDGALFMVLLLARPR